MLNIIFLRMAFSLFRSDCKFCHFFNQRYKYNKESKFSKGSMIFISLHAYASVSKIHQNFWALQLCPSAKIDCWSGPNMVAKMIIYNSKRLSWGSSTLLSRQLMIPGVFLFAEPVWVSNFYIFIAVDCTASNALKIWKVPA